MHPDSLTNSYNTPLGAAHQWVCSFTLLGAPHLLGALLTVGYRSVESLPQELQRNFMLMRQLDTRTQELMAKIERNTRDVLRRRENLTEQRTDDLV